MQMKKVTYIITLLAFVSSVVLYSCKRKEGCKDNQALNYDEEAKKDNGSCEYLDDNIQSFVNHNEAQKEFDDVLTTEENAMRDFDNDMDKSGSGQVFSDTTCD